MGKRLLQSVFVVVVISTIAYAQSDFGLRLAEYGSTRRADYVFPSIPVATPFPHPGQS
jgi:hypothetical protein